MMEKGTNFDELDPTGHRQKKKQQCHGLVPRSPAETDRIEGADSSLILGTMSEQSEWKHNAHIAFESNSSASQFWIFFKPLQLWVVLTKSPKYKSYLPDSKVRREGNFRRDASSFLLLNIISKQVDNFQRMDLQAVVWSNSNHSKPQFPRPSSLRNLSKIAKQRNSNG